MRASSQTRCALIFFFISATTAFAQNRGFRLDRYDGTSAGSTQFLVERPWYSETRSFAVSLTFDGAYNPLVPKLATGGADLVPIISLAAVGHLELAWAPFSRLQLHAKVPVSLFEQGRAELLSGVSPLKTASVGDPSAGAFLRLVGRPQRDAFSLHVGADVWVPIGAQARHQGDSGVRLLGHVTASGAFGIGRYAVDLGFLFRPYASFGPPALGMVAASEARGGVSLGLSLWSGRLTVGPEALFSTQVLGLNAFTRDGMSLEVVGGATVLIADTLLVGVAGGAGFLSMAGTPDARAMLRVAWAPKKSVAPAPIELTTVVAELDGGTATSSPVVAAPPAVAAAAEEDEDDERTEAEIAQAREAAAAAEAKARAEADADGDGVPDVVDRCPYEAETANGLRETDGCPEIELERDAALTQVLMARAVSTPADAGTPGVSGASGASGAAPVEVDSDKDGVVDGVDRCPATAEDGDGFEDEDGCAEADNDGDHIVDAADRCPDVAETVNGVDDQDGCPDVAPDGDKDGVADAVDRCPLEPESTNGVRDDDGCPETLPTAEAAVLGALVAPPPQAPLSEADGAAPVVSKRAPPDIDSDKDTVPDLADRCPSSPEDRDGFEDDDGCPELDNDDDGVVDPKDRCPFEAETVNGYKDQDGCPDEVVDTDSDGVAYDEDRCPLEPGDASDGCPHPPKPPIVTTMAELMAAVAAEQAAAVAQAARETDSDHDGVVDEADACPTSAEDTDGFEDEDGCPELDNDHDGVADARDACPLEAETINGVKDDDGCPDVGKQVVAIRGDKVVIDGVVRFKTASANLERSATPLLLQVASTLKAAATISVEIQGHTDDVGNAAKNIKLSQRRAETILKVLIKAGVSPTRLRASGYGPTRPRAPNQTAAGREQNRRVEFQILGESK